MAEPDNKQPAQDKAETKPRSRRTTTAKAESAPAKTEPKKDYDFSFANGVCQHCGIRLRRGLGGEPVCPVLAQSCPRHHGVN